MYGIGIIGCGAIAQRRHAPEYAANKNCRLVGFYDPDTARAEQLAAQYNARAYATLEELLADPAIDAVSVCTSNNTHASISEQACLAGKHVLCEKPMATRVDQAQRMIDAAKEKGRVLMIAHNQRFEPAHRIAKELLESGQMGRVLSFQTAFSHGGPEQWLNGKPGQKIWFFNRSQTGFGVLGDLGVHKLDLICWLLGDQVKRAQAFIATRDKRTEDGAFIPVEDNVTMILQFAGGAIGTLFASWTSYGAEDHLTVLNCEKGVIRLYDGQEKITVIHADGSKCYYHERLEQLERETNGSGVIDRFIDGIAAGKSPIPGEEALAVLQTIESALKSEAKD